MSKFIVNVLKLFSATLAGQIIATILIPVLSRLYSPADFGLFQLFFSIVSLIAIIACFSYHQAIMLPKDDEESAGIVLLCIFLIVITTIVTTVFFFVFSESISQMLNAPDFSTYIFLLPIAILCNSIAYVLGYWLSRREQFGSIASGNFLASVSGKAVSIGYGSVSPSPAGLIFGTIIHDATLVAVLIKRTAADIRLFRSVSYEQMKQLAVRYKRFPQFSTGTNLASIASLQVTPFLLAFFFSPAIVGYYAMTYMVIHMPSKLIGNSITSIFFQKASVEKNLTGSAKKIVKTVHSRLISLGIFICLVLMTAGPELFSFALGAQWSVAGIYAQILAPWFFVAFISTPLFSIFSIFEKQTSSLAFNLLLLLSRIIVIVISGLLADPILAMLLLSSTGVLFWTWMNMYLLKTAGVSVREGLQEILYYLALGALFCMPIILAKYYSVTPTLLFAILVFMTGGYYLVVIYQDTQLREGLLNILKTILPK